MGSAPLRSSAIEPQSSSVGTKMMSNQRKSTIDDDESLSSDINENFARLEVAYKYLMEKNDAKEILESKSCLKKVLFISNLSLLDEFRQMNRHFKILPKYNMQEIFTNLLTACFDDTRAFVNKYEYYDDPDVKKSDDSTYKKLKRSFLFLFELSNIILQYTDTCIWFCLNFHEKGGSKIVLDYLADEIFLENCKRFKTQKYDDKVSGSPKENKSGLALTRHLVGIVHNLTKIADEYKQDWQNLKATAKLLKFSEIFNKYGTHRITAYMAIANIVNDKEIETLPNTRLVVEDLIRIVYLGGQALRTKTGLSYTKIDLSQSGKMDTEVSVIAYEDAEFNLIELLEALNKLAVNDSIKYSIYTSFKTLDTIKNILFNGNAIEKEYATKLLWQLCFDRRVCQDVANENVLVEYLRKQLSEKSASYVYKQNITGIMWLYSQLRVKDRLNDSSLDLDYDEAIIKDAEDYRFKSRRTLSSSDEDERSMPEEKEALPSRRDKKKKENRAPIRRKETDKRSVEKPSKQSDSRQSSIIHIVSPPQTTLPTVPIKEKNVADGLEKKGHIMISYNRETRDLCLNIKQELINMGHQVWIDVDDIHGSSLESMARAIENSACVLICMTEKYKQSPYCRAEAEYTFNLGKPYVPLIMQANYTPDGWLGIILGSKIFVNFTKYEYKECVRRLKNEIVSVMKPESHSIQNDPNKPDILDANLRQEKHLVTSRPPQGARPNESIHTWSNQEVNEWLKKNAINSSIKRIVESFDGTMLDELYSVYKEAPEYYYLAISQRGQIELSEVLKFSRALKSLY